MNDLLTTTMGVLKSLITAAVFQVATHAEIHLKFVQTTLPPLLGLY